MLGRMNGNMNSRADNISVCRVAWILPYRIINSLTTEFVDRRVLLGEYFYYIMTIERTNMPSICQSWEFSKYNNISSLSPLLFSVNNAHMTIQYRTFQYDPYQQVDDVIHLV